MKIAFSILCSLMLLWAQAVVAATPAAHEDAQDCGCSGKMACCQTAPVSQPAPLNATTSGASQPILSYVPAMVVWVSPAAGTSAFSPAPSTLLTVDAMPLFARNCVRLI